MQTKHIGMVKALAFCAPFALTFGLMACDDSSTGANDKGSGDTSGKTSPDPIFTDIKAGGCDFKKDDKVWKYTFTVKQKGAEANGARYFKYDGDDTVDSVVTVSTGTQVTQACRYMDGKEVDEEEEDGVKTVSTAWCEGKTFYVSDVTTGAFDGVSRSEAFKMVMADCEQLNKGVDNYNSSSSEKPGSSSSTDEEDDEVSSSSVKDKPSSSSEKGKSSSSVQGGDDEDVALICNFKKDDDVWTVDMAEYGIATVTWKGTTCTVANDMALLVGADLCRVMMSEEPEAEDGETIEQFCKGDTLISRTSRVVEDADRDEMYAEIELFCTEPTSKPSRAEACAEGLSEDCLVGAWNLERIQAKDGNLVFMDLSEAPSKLEFADDGKFMFRYTSDASVSEMAAGCDESVTVGVWKISGENLELKITRGDCVVAGKTFTLTPTISDGVLNFNTIVFHENDIADAMARDNSTEIYVLADE